MSVFLLLGLAHFRQSRDTCFYNCVSVRHFIHLKAHCNYCLHPDPRHLTHPYAISVAYAALISKLHALEYIGTVTQTLPFYEHWTVSWTLPFNLRCDVNDSIWRQDRGKVEVREKQLDSRNRSLSTYFMFFTIRWSHMPSMGRAKARRGLVIDTWSNEEKEGGKKSKEKLEKERGETRGKHQD